MIILHSQKMIFFRNPKTGSTSLQASIMDSGVFDVDMDVLNPEIEGSELQSIHTTPQIAYDAGILTNDMLKTYKMYTVVRKPDDRVMSAVKHILKPVRVSVLRAKRILESPQNLGKLFARPQMDWLTVNGEMVVTPILFDKYRQEVTGIFKSLGVKYENIHRNVGSQLRKTSDIFEVGSQISKTYKAFYSEDWQIYNYIKRTPISRR